MLSSTGAPRYRNNAIRNSEFGMRPVARNEARRAFNRNRAEMPQVQSGDRVGVQPLGGRDHDRVDESQSERLVATVDVARRREIVIVPPLDNECAVSEVADERLP